MKIITWNLNHRTIEKPIPEGVLVFITDSNPDVIVLTEFVDGKSREYFKETLAELGYSYQLLSSKVGKQNQVFIASKFEFAKGVSVAPNITSPAETNYLHVFLPRQELNIIGFRAPSYKTSKERKAYWKQLAGIASSISKKNTIFLGDINYDPFTGISAFSTEIEFSLAGTYKIPNPEGEWSFISIDGKNKTRIDHAILSESLKLKRAEYITAFNGIVLAGSKNDSAITDHAVLSVELEI